MTIPHEELTEWQRLCGEALEAAIKEMEATGETEGCWFAKPHDATDYDPIRDCKNVLAAMPRLIERVRELEKEIAKPRYPIGLMDTLNGDAASPSATDTGK